MSRCDDCYRSRLGVCDWIEPPEECVDYKPYWVCKLKGKKMRLSVPGLTKPVMGRITGASDEFFIFHSNGRDYIVDYICDYVLRKA